MADQHFLPWGDVDPRFWQSAPRPPASAMRQLLDQPRRDHPPTPPSPAPEPTPVTTSPPPAAPPAAPRTTAEPSTAAVPPEFLEQVAAISTAAEQGRLPEAAAAAARVDDEITAAYGAVHAHTINIRQLRGYIAAQMGGNAAAARWFLHTSQLWIDTVGPGDPRSKESVRHAAGAWQRIQAPATLRELAPALLTLLAAVEGADSKAVRVVRAHLATASDEQKPRLAQPLDLQSSDPRSDVTGHQRAAGGGD